MFFFARAESVGGSEGMFKVAETIWGIGFRGALSNFLFEIFSIDIIFIVFYVFMVFKSRICYVKHNIRGL